LKKEKYTIGLDIGTTSVGWAVIDDDFNLVQDKKKITEIDADGNVARRKSRVNLWGVRLFEAGQVAADRRIKRGGRRRLARRKKRLNYLREIFEPEILLFDDSFFIRMDESFYQNDDKSNKTIEAKYPFFNGIEGSGETYSNEIDYYEKYPTIYHLRERLIENPEQADLRLVYLAMHHILKFRGHFVNQGQDFNMKNIDVVASLSQLLERYADEDVTSFDFEFEKYDKTNDILTNRGGSKSEKASELTKLYNVLTDENYAKCDIDMTKSQAKKFLESKNAQQRALFTAVVGNGIDLAKIFDNPGYNQKENAEMPKAGEFKYSLDADKFEEKLTVIEAYITPEEFEIILLGKNVYESIVLCNILTANSLSASMVEKFNLHKKQLEALKVFTKSISYDFYATFFKEEGIYTKFIQGSGNPSKRTSREDFYKEVKKEFENEFKGLKFPDAGKDFDFSKAENITEEQQKELAEMAVAMEFETYLPKQRMSDNGAIPYQIHEDELIKIIENQSVYYPFLGEQVIVGENDNTKSEFKIQTLMKFRIPYYIGPLTPATLGNPGNKTSDISRFAWMQKRTDEKITPWNFDRVVDKEASAVEFIERMTSFCTFLPDKKVLPKNSLLYQEYTIYNELIIGGYYLNGKRCYFPSALRQKIVDKLFKHNKKVSAKMMLDFLNKEESLNLESPKELFGIDTFVKSPSYNTTFSTFIDLVKALKDDETTAEMAEQLIEDNRKKFEEIIKWQTIFEDNKVLKKRIKTANAEWNNLLTPAQVNKLSKKHYTGWGRLSKELLDGIKASNGKTIIANLKEEKYNNFMRLIDNDEQIIEQIRKAQVGDIDVNELNYDMVKNLAGSPAIKKGIWQSLKIIAELEQYLGKDKIGKIVVEMAREDGQGRSTKRIKQIENFYKNFKEKTGEDLSVELKRDFDMQAEESFNNEKLFLYFMQNGKCMYSGRSLNISELSSYEVDHIIPQTFIKDDSFDNKVLVLRTENQNKGGDVPAKGIVWKMRDFWETLAKNGQVSPKKLANLTKGSLSEKDKDGFINRQLVETRQITKHVANILASHFKEDEVEILTPKSSLTNQFREGVVYVPAKEFNAEEAVNNGMTYEVGGMKYFPNLESVESRYSNSSFVRVHFHEGFKKNRDINDYHHAHDAYLNAVVATYIYHIRPDLRKMWVYGEYQRKANIETGKWGSQRKNFGKQLLTGMADLTWEGWDLETGEVLELWKRDEVLEKIQKNLGLRGMNIVKKTEVQIGKFGDESVKKKNKSAIPVKSKLDPERYGGATAPISAFTVLVKNNKDEIKPLSIPSAVAKAYLNSDTKVEFMKPLYPKAKIEEIVIEKVPKYTHYILPNGGHRLVASFQEAKPAIQLPMMVIVNAKSNESELLEVFDSFSSFIQKNKLFSEGKLPLLDTEIKEYFENTSSDEKSNIINEMMRVTKGSNQGLNALKKSGLGAIKQQLTGSENIITNNTTLIYQSTTGLYETRKKL